MQDWGGILGLTLPVEPDIRPRISRLLLMNTTIAVGQSPGPAFEAWRAYVASTDDLPVGPILARAVPEISAAETAADDAPFPDAANKAGVRRIPQLVMTDPTMPGVEISQQAARFWSEEWLGPTFMAIGAQDSVLGPPTMERLRAQIRGGPAPLVLQEAGHFGQESGDTVANAALSQFAAANDVRS